MTIFTPFPLSKKLHIWLLIYHLILCPFSSAAQIVGTLTDAKTELPLAYVRISLFSTPDSQLIAGTLSNEKGQFTLSSGDTGHYMLNAQLIGYQQIQLPITLLVKDSLIDLGIISLTPEIYQLEEVEIRARKSRWETQMGKKILYVGQDLANSGNSALTLLDNLPSVETNLDGTILIRGDANVILYINGQETNKDGLSLQNIPADRIEQIELITNPPAQYDAEGVAGIINIIYKKETQDGMNLTLSGNAGWPQSLGGGISANVKTSAWNFYVNSSGRRARRAKSRLKIERESLDSQRALQDYQLFELNTNRYAHVGVNPGISWQPDTTLRLTLDLAYDYWGDSTISQQQNTFFFKDGLNQSFPLQNVDDNVEHEFNISLSLQKEFFLPQHRLQFQLRHYGENEDVQERFNTEALSLEQAPISTFLESSSTEEAQRYWEAKIDYQIPISSFGLIKLGGEGTDIAYDISQQFTFFQPDIWLEDNDFSVSQWKHATYLLHEYTLNRFSYSLGIRWEYFQSRAIQRQNDSSFSQSFSNLFPSFQLGYYLNESQRHFLGISYSKRIERPSFFDINPYVYFVDPLNLERGNPFLEPVFADSWELGYEWNTDYFEFLATCFYRHKENTIQSVNFAEGESVITSYQNFAEEKNQGLELIANADGIPWFTLNNQFTFYYRSFSTYTASAPALINNSQFSWSFRHSQTLSWADNWQLEITEYFRSPRVGPQTRYLSQFYLNMGLRRSLWDGKLALTLSAGDVLRTRINLQESQNDAFLIRQEQRYPFRYIRLGFQWKMRE